GRTEIRAIGNWARAMDRSAWNQVRCRRRTAWIPASFWSYFCITVLNTDCGNEGPDVPFGVGRTMPHKFSLGQSVRYSGAPFGDRAGDLEFTIVRHLPEASYRIKAADEPNERVARENELRPADLEGS